MRCVNALALGIALLAVAAGLSAARAAEHTLALFTPAGALQQGFARIINHSDRAGTVRIHGTDDDGKSHGPVTLHLDARAARHFTSNDLEEGNASKGLSGGLGDGEGSWRLRLETDLDIEPAAYLHTSDGFFASVHDVAPATEVDGKLQHQAPIFNPGSNRNQVSWLRLVNLSDSSVDVTIRGRDDAGDPAPGGEVRLTLPAGAARRISAAQLESGGDGLSGRFGDGEGRWRLFVEANGEIEVVSLLQTPAGHLANLSMPNRRPAGKLNAGSVFRDCPECPEMVVVPAGSFLMGSPEDEANRDSNEGPLHRVTIGEPLAVGRYEVTFAQWDACRADGGCSHRDDHGWGRGDRPVVDVTWNLAQHYVRWLSRETGRRYRLPSEAEWEYAARAGTTTRYWWGNDIGQNRANCDGCGSAWDARQTAPVGSFQPNPFGLHDVHGNVREWVQDCSNESYHGAPSDGSAWETEFCVDTSYRVTSDRSCRVIRVHRGGGWFSDPGKVRSADRSSDPACIFGGSAGFRVASHAPSTDILPFFRAAGRRDQGLARIINRSNRAGTVRIYGIDDLGQRRGPITLRLEPNQARHFSSRDLEDGNAGLSDGLGNGVGDWRLELVSTLDIEPSAYIRTTDGLLTPMHDAVRTVDPDGTTVHRVPIFNPGSNRNQVSWLRVANLTDRSVDVTIRGIDDAGQSAPGGDVVLTLSARAARRVSAQQLESGLSSLSGRLGDGTGRWRLLVTADGDIEVVSLLQSPTGHLSNLSASGLVDLGKLEIAAPGPNRTEPLERIALQVPGGLSRKSDYTVLIDISGTGAFNEGNVFEVPGFTTDRDEVLFAAPMPQVLSPATLPGSLSPPQTKQCDASLICGQAVTCVDGMQYPTTCGPDNCDEPIGACPGVVTEPPQFSVRLRRELDGRLSNVLQFFVNEIEVPEDLAGYPIAILDTLLHLTFTYSDDEVLNNEVNKLPPPGRLADLSQRLRLDTSFTDALAEALLGRLFGVSVVDAFEEFEKDKQAAVPPYCDPPPAVEIAVMATDGTSSDPEDPVECEPEDDAPSAGAGSSHAARTAAPPPALAGGGLFSIADRFRAFFDCADGEFGNFQACSKHISPGALIRGFWETANRVAEIAGHGRGFSGNWANIVVEEGEGALGAHLQDTFWNPVVGGVVKALGSVFRSSDKSFARNCPFHFCTDTSGDSRLSRRGAVETYRALRDQRVEAAKRRYEQHKQAEKMAEALAKLEGTQDPVDAFSELETISLDQAFETEEIADAGESYFTGEEEDPGGQDPTEGSKVCTVRGDLSRFAELASSGSSACPNDVVVTEASLDVLVSSHQAAGYLLFGETETWRLGMRDYGFPPVGRAAGWDCELLIEPAYDNAINGLPSPAEFTAVHLCPYGDDDTEPSCESRCSCPDPDSSGYSLCQYKVDPPPTYQSCRDPESTCIDGVPCLPLCQ